jgi:phage baseplate assembly protein W
MATPETSGLKFPIELSPMGSVELSTGAELIESAIRTILTWPKFTRWYLSAFGTRFMDLLEEPNDRITQGLAEIFILEAFNSLEDRVTLLEVATLQQDDKLLVAVTVQIKTTLELLYIEQNLIP